jgi:hypothetical protein
MQILDSESLFIVFEFAQRKERIGGVKNFRKFVIINSSFLILH